MIFCSVFGPYELALREIVNQLGIGKKLIILKSKLFLSYSIPIINLGSLKNIEGKRWSAPMQPRWTSPSSSSPFHGQYPRTVAEIFAAWCAFECTTEDGPPLTIPFFISQSLAAAYIRLCASRFHDFYKRVVRIKATLCHALKPNRIF